MIARRRGGAAVVVGCAVLGLTGCGAHTATGPTTYVTVTVAAPAAAESTVAASSSRPTPTPRPVAMRKLPGSCASLLPLGSIVDAIGHNVRGATAFVVGAPDPTIDRVSYLNCRYGLAKSQPTATIEIGVSLYRTAAKAEARIRPTVEDYTQHAATASATKVSGRPATVLHGGAGAGYGPTIVLAVGQRTIAVTLRPGAIVAARVQRDLVALAALAAERTAIG